MLKTEEHKLATMAINRILTMCIIAIAVLVIVGVVLPLALLYSLPVSISRMEDLCITGVQFEEDYLNITVKNNCDQTKIVNKVTIRNLITTYDGFSINRTSIPLTVAVHEPISDGEEISFCISVKWTSEFGYQIQLGTEDRSLATSYNAFIP